MKKFLALALALVTLLGMAMPAAAYTQNSPGAAGSQFKLSIRLVDYYDSGDILSGWLSQPAADRGYARNEVVAAVASITIPANEFVGEDGYRQIQFVAKNVTFKVRENINAAGNYELVHNVPLSSWKNPAAWQLKDDGKRLVMDFSRSPGNSNAFPIASSSKTYSFLIYGKVTKEGASISFELAKEQDFQPVGGSGWQNTGAFMAAPGISASNADKFLILNSEYLVIRQKSGNYIVFEHTEKNGYNGNAYPQGKPLFRIEIGKRNKTTALYMYTARENGPLYRIHVEPSTKELIFLAVAGLPDKVIGDQIKITDKNYKALRAYYDAHFEKGLGFTAYNEGNILAEKDWGLIAAQLSGVAKVELLPYTDYPRAR